MNISIGEAACKLCAGEGLPLYALSELQDALSVAPDGAYGPVTHAAVMAYLAANSGSQRPTAWLTRVGEYAPGRNGETDIGGTMGTLTWGDERDPVRTLERAWLDNRRGVSCIPRGSYLCFLAHSPRFGPETPHVEIVEGRSHILIHAANWPKQLEGCIALGLEAAADEPAVYRSRDAMVMFRSWLQDAGGACLLHVGGVVG